MEPLTPQQFLDCTQTRLQLPAIRDCEVWLLTARANAPGNEMLEELLSVDERKRATRFRFEEDRVRFIVGRAAARWILASYCSVSPDRIQFRRGSHGKPALLTPSASVEFNVSHSGEYVMVAVTSDTECGVDIECARPRAEEISIAANYFSGQEMEWLSRTEAGFLRLWTGKEAIVKALGGGLSVPLCDFDITRVLEGSTSSITISTRGHVPRTVWLNEVAVPPGYAAAVATLSERRIVAGSGRLPS